MTALTVSHPSRAVREVPALAARTLDEHHSRGDLAQQQHDHKMDAPKNQQSLRRQVFSVFGWC